MTIPGSSLVPSTEVVLDLVAERVGGAGAPNRPPAPILRPPMAAIRLASAARRSASCSSSDNSGFSPSASGTASSSTGTGSSPCVSTGACVSVGSGTTAASSVVGEVTTSSGNFAESTLCCFSGCSGAAAVAPPIPASAALRLSALMRPGAGLMAGFSGGASELDSRSRSPRWSAAMRSLRLILILL